MEQLLHYTWKHKLFPLHELRTTDGKLVEVLSPGMHNTDAGPDFIEAKVKIDGAVWAGNVEIHTKTSDWFRHHHDTDKAYENVILHVASDIDCPLQYPDGKAIPQLQLDIPKHVQDNYAELSRNDHRPRCRKVVEKLPQLMIHNWMTSLMLERFEERTQQILARRETLDKDWESTLFVTIARNFGFGLNGDAFETWASSIPMNAVAKHRDNLFQVEAIFFGQAGLLDADFQDEYFLSLKKEYRYLRQKFSLAPISPNAWKFLRLRPQNFPYIRIAQLAMLYHEQRLNLSRLINAAGINEVSALLLTHTSDYWKTHYCFGGQASKPRENNLSKSSVELIVINSIAPTLFAYGKYKSDQHLCDHAFSLWEQLKAENNRITREWASAGISCDNAADSQALIQLTRQYCQPHDCLRCQFGYEFIKRTPDFLREEEGADNNPLQK
ncbi:MAG: DUF2851 family protein [Prevotellaceae bacterium]|nr:DUF2851 family protein [Prevotellaceae bacterium]